MVWASDVDLEVKETMEMWSMEAAASLIPLLLRLLIFFPDF